MHKKKCYACGKEPLTKDEIGLTKKFVDMNSKYFFCIDCLADQLEVDSDFLRARVEEFKEQGCVLF